ncbi:MAG: enhanced serine sensitivity protein SseB C-terminal domain-containing protein [Bacteroidetes bacterium]|nr:enhanced serine sensitivity protein SseB C-terminal domain-containing protein [Bacteroidota bacterium]
MGFFDNFKRKTYQTNKDNLNSENVIETSLRKALTEPAYRPEFYKKLLTEKLIILTNKQQGIGGFQTLQENTTVSIATLTDGKIPVFTSNPKIFDKGIIKEEVPILEMKGEDLFNLAKDATFVLNPFSEFWKELLPNEIESLLNGTILTDNHKQINIQEATQVQIGQPKNYPTEIVGSLKALFTERPSVKAAYLGWIFNPSTGEPPHLIFALDIDGEKQVITNEAGYTAQQASSPNDIIDFIQIDNNGGLSDYFIKQTKPFYVR